MNDLHQRGLDILENGVGTSDQLPFEWWTDVRLRQTFEYPVADYPSEVAFFIDMFGLTFIALSDDYALLTTANEDFTFSFRTTDKSVDLSPFELQFFVSNLTQMAKSLRHRGVEFTITEDSPGQRVIHFSSPNGLPIAIWNGYEG